MNPTSRPILLVDDTRHGADLFRGALLRNNLENPFLVVGSTDEANLYLGGEAQYAERDRYPLPHLLLIDPNLNGKDGWELLQWVRKQPEFRNLIVIMYGGNGTLKETEKAQRLGANGCHPKPETPDELDCLVKRIGDFWLMGAPSA